MAELDFIEYEKEIDVTKYDKRIQEQIRSIEKNLAEQEIHYVQEADRIESQLNKFIKENKKEYSLYEQGKELKKDNITLDPNTYSAYEKFCAVFEKKKNSLATLHLKYSNHIQTYLKRRKAAVSQGEESYLLEQSGVKPLDTEKEKAEKVHKFQEGRKTETEQKETLEQTLIHLQADLGELLASDNELQRLVKNYTKERNKHSEDSRDYRYYDRKIEQFQLYRAILQKRAQDRREYINNKEKQKYHFTDTEVTDQGYSTPEEVQLKHKFFNKAVIRNSVRVKLTISSESEVQSEEENLSVRNLIVGEPSEDEDDLDMANHMRWSIQNISKFYGNPNQDPEYHVREFEDVLKASNQWPEDVANVADPDASRIIVHFITTLSNRARAWVEQQIPMGERVTWAHYETLKTKFLEHFNLSGSTPAQRNRAFREMRWDPTTQSIEDYSYKFEKLGASLGFNQEALVCALKATLPSHMIWFLKDENTVQAISRAIKKLISEGMPLVQNNPIMPTAAVNVMPAQPATQQAKFMSMKDSSSKDLVEELKDTFEKTLEDKFNMVGEEVFRLGTELDTLNMMVGSQKPQPGWKSGQNNGGRSFRQNFRNSRGRANSQNNGRNGANPMRCSFCKLHRHTIDSCWKLASVLKTKGMKLVPQANGNGSNGTRGNGNGRGRSNQASGSMRGKFNPMNSRDSMNSLQDDVDDSEDDEDEDLDEEDTLCMAFSELQHVTGMNLVYDSTN